MIPTSSVVLQLKVNFAGGGLPRGIHEWKTMTHNYIMETRRVHGEERTKGNGTSTAFALFLCLFERLNLFRISLKKNETSSTSCAQVYCCVIFFFSSLIHKHLGKPHSLASNTALCRPHLHTLL